ncbi:hypothetical protein BN381_450064 [Candidatus Microthrix parvicella RN1]|uniref:Uncharacterized protein n=1 Tax=Candidatus Neomicrothrix parvicella RN1 TaxID=1229780 RepID=R4Z206_9ACTN|nr:hypothetical protein BN381_450064 [Candidatus Microthrix parvicella RN1]
MVREASEETSRTVANPLDSMSGSLG